MGSIAERVLGLVEELAVLPECPNLWKVIYKRIAIDELPTLAFILTKAATEELYQFVGN